MPVAGVALNPDRIGAAIEQPKGTMPRARQRRRNALNQRRAILAADLTSLAPTIWSWCRSRDRGREWPGRRNGAAFGRSPSSQITALGGLLDEQPALASAGDHAEAEQPGGKQAHRRWSGTGAEVTGVATSVRSVPLIEYVPLV